VCAVCLAAFQAQKGVIERAREMNISAYSLGGLEEAVIGLVFG